MKKLYTLLCTVLFTVALVAQAPQKISYQAIIRNSSNALLPNTAIGMRISILQTSGSGTAVYVETQSPTTNANGLATVEIGGGSVVSGVFANIDWSAGPYFIKTEIAVVPPLTTYTITGTSQLLSVPYALAAKTAASYTETDPIYTAWNKSSGISITASQVSDFQTSVTNNAAMLLNTAKISYPPADAAKVALLSGTNTGDETAATIKTKLGITTLSGSNTGDQTIALTGDVTGTGTGTFAATISNNAVTYGKMQAVGATNRLLGSSSTTTNVQEISLGSGLSLTGTTLSATGGGGTVTNFSAGDLAPLFTTTEATTTTTPALSFSLTNAGAYSLFGNNTASAAAPAYFTPILASALFQNQGTVTGLLHGNAAGNPSWGQIVNADITNATIDLTTKVTGILPLANGGTGSATKNFMDLTTVQTIGGAKTFTADISALNLSGTNTGDQTITLTGEVSGSGTGSFATTVSNASVIGKVLTGFGPETGTITAADNILHAIQKLNGNLGALVASSSHNLGDDYLGGIIFSVYKDNLGNEHGLIVAKTETGPVSTVWGPLATSTGATSIWNGAANTALMGSSTEIQTYLTGLGAGWYVPSADELLLLRSNLYYANKGLAAAAGTLIGFNDYWSSTEVDGDNATSCYFVDGKVYVGSKSGSGDIRAIRSF